MKNKLFLTSMLVMLTVSPAFAVVTTVPDDNDSSTPESGFILGESSANCYGDALTYQDNVATSGTVTYTAGWTPHQCEIVLNTDDYDAQNNPTGRGGDNSAAYPISPVPTKLYTTYGEGAYLDPARTSQYLMTYSPQSHPLSVTPVGKGVTLALNVNLPPVYAGTAPSNSSVNGALAFNGFWANTTTTTSSDQYIDATKYITSYGNAAAAGLYESTQDPQTGEALCPDTTWYAQYTCGNVTYSNLADLDSHTFAGWYTDPTNGTQAISPYCINQDETIYAHWTPKTFDIIYNPGSCAGEGTTIDDVLTYGQNYNLTTMSGASVSLPSSAYTFQGWASTSGATTADVCDGTTADCSGLGPWTTAGNLTVYAVCTGNGYYINYNCGTANGTTITGPATPSQGVTAGTTYVLAPANNCSAPGYTFVGWDCPNLATATPNVPATTGGQNVWFGAGYSNTYSVAGSVTCTAQWRSNPINLEWYLDDANTQSYNNPQSCNFGVANDISPLTEPTKTGYTFTGWTVTDWTE